MHHRFRSFVARNAGQLTVLALLLAFLLLGGVGEVAAHNLAGIEVPGCTNGAESVAQHNPNCHG